MARTTLARAAAALVAAVAIGGLCAAGSMAQESQGSTVTVGGGVTGVEAGGIQVVAPGVTIDGGDVTNDTGIGVIIGGGSSVGATSGGDENASVTE
jgi:hypothetical protein